MAVVACPSRDDLRRLLNGAATDHPELIAHLDTCPTCQQTLEQLADADALLREAAAGLRLKTLVDEEPLRRVLDSLGNSVTLPTSGPRDRVTWVQSLLAPARTPAAIGQLDDYEVTDILGQGGMGVVLKAYDAALKRWVAIKVLAPDLAGDSVSRQRFAREAQAAAAVHHRNIITIYAVRESAGLPFFVMEYVSGGSLQDLVDTNGRPAWQAAARIGTDIALGLAAAHARGLIHRDIKPSNILLSPRSQAEDPRPSGNLGASTVDLGRCDAKIADFGLARVADDSRLTRTGIIAGTPMYMAPEQAMSGPLDHRADLFSLGSVLYTLCTGAEPFPAGGPVAVLRQVCEATPRPIRELNPEVPPWMVSLIDRLQAKHPADRPASAALVAELVQFNLEHPDRPRMLSPVRKPRLQKRRVLLGAALTVGVLAGGTAVSESLHWTHLLGNRRVSASIDQNVLLEGTLRGHEGPVWAVAYSPDGRTLATGSDDTTIRFWQASTGRPEAAITGQGNAIQGVVYAASGKFLVSGNGDGAIHVWDAATRTQEATLLHTGLARRLALSPDDTTLAVPGGNQTVELWDLKSRKIRLELTGHYGTIYALAYAPNGQTIATGDAKGTIRLWDPGTAREIAHFAGDGLGMRALAFSPDSKVLASAGTGDRDVKLWDTATEQCTARLSGIDSPVMSLAISPDGELLAAGTRDGMVNVWSLPNDRLLATLHAHDGSVWGMSFSPDGRTLATVGEDRLGRLWNVGSLAAHGA